MTETVSVVLAALAVVLQVVLLGLLALALVALFASPARRALAHVAELVRGGELWAAWVVATVATLGSLFFSEYSDFIPCRLCWYQRIAMYPLAALLLIAALRRDFRAGALYALPFPVVGGMIAGWHIYVENNPEVEGSGCKIGAPCSTKWIEEFGYVTIPTLALTAFAAILVLLLMARRGGGRPAA